MRKMRKQDFRKLRFFLDALIALVLLLGVFAALSSRAYREETRFRRAEKAALAGPSEILDRIDVPEDWPAVGYDRLLIGDDGEEILFYAVRNGRGLPLERREKTEGILLTPVFNWGTELASRRESPVMPLFLFVDDPAAVRAEVRIRLSADHALELTQARGADAVGDGSARERFFLFPVPLPENRGSVKMELLQELYWTGTASAHMTYAAFPAVIRLYDASGALLETREYTIRAPYAG